MMTITAIVRAKPERDDEIEEALLAVAEYVAKNESKTIGYYVSRKLDDPLIFTIYARFEDRAALDAHSNSAIVSRFQTQTRPALDGEPVVEIGEEISAH